MSTENNSPTLIVLKRAKSILEGGWTQEYMARNSDGEGVLETSPEAVKWCPIGAIKKAAYAYTLGGNYSPREEAQFALNQQIGLSKTSLSNWNDDPLRTQEEVLEAFTKTIESLSL